jgi:hypothetical protein
MNEPEVNTSEAVPTSSDTAGPPASSTRPVGDDSSMAKKIRKPRGPVSEERKKQLLEQLARGRATRQKNKETRLAAIERGEPIPKKPRKHVQRVPVAPDSANASDASSPYQKEFIDALMNWGTTMRLNYNNHEKSQLKDTIRDSLEDFHRVKQQRKIAAKENATAAAAAAVTTAASKSQQTDQSAGQDSIKKWREFI